MRRVVEEFRALGSLASGVVLEFQCPSGVDYEIDARHEGVMKRLDDKIDPSGAEAK